MKKKSTRYKFILSKKEYLLQLLGTLSEKENISYTELKTRSNLKGGAFQAPIADLGIMKLIDNGGRYSVLDLGKQILKDKQDNSLWKKAALNVPLYLEYHNASQGNKQHETMLIWIIRHYPNIEDSLIGMIVRRYFEIVFPDIELPPKFDIKILRRNPQKKLLDIPPKTNNKNLIFSEEVCELINHIKILKNRYSKEDVDKAWRSLE